MYGLLVKVELSIVRVAAEHGSLTITWKENDTPVSTPCGEKQVVVTVNGDEVAATGLSEKTV